jgi:hypothetical protein
MEVRKNVRRRMFRGMDYSHGFRGESPFQKGDLKYVILDLLKENLATDTISSVRLKKSHMVSTAPAPV